MIKRFRHRGLERFFLKGTKAGIQAKHAKRLRLILARLDASVAAKDMDLPGLRLHELNGKTKRNLGGNGQWKLAHYVRV